MLKSKSNDTIICLKKKLTNYIDWVSFYICFTWQPEKLIKLKQNQFKIDILEQKIYIKHIVIKMMVFARDKNTRLSFPKNIL